MKLLKKKSKQKKVVPGHKVKYVLDCTGPANDNIINTAGLVTFNYFYKIINKIKNCILGNKNVIGEVPS